MRKSVASERRKHSSVGDHFDVIVIGAGVAGLVAAAELAEAALSVTIVEARERIGGRIYSVAGPKGFPIELGAEFIHGRPSEIVHTLRHGKIPITEVKGKNWCVDNNRLISCDLFEEVDDILQQMKDDGSDESFASFLSRCCPEASAKGKQRALSYVSGFNAADPARVSVHWLIHQMRAEEETEGDRAFRARGGYASLLKLLEQRLAKAGVKVWTKTIVRRVTWIPGKTEIEAVGCEGTVLLHAKRVLVTVPVGVLQARPGESGAIEFCPTLPQDKLRSIAGIEMGKVLRIVLQFRRRFWSEIHPQGDERKSLINMSFLFSQDDWFPTWWTAMPETVPIITGWAADECAARLESDTLPIVMRALQRLGALLGVGTAKMERMLNDAYFHDWQIDPYSRGAYSYAKVGASEAPAILARPVQDTLFFAGEASDVTGNNGTVHGAIASGRRAVTEITRTGRASASN